MPIDGKLPIDRSSNNITIDTTELQVVEKANLQDFVEGVDHSLLAARGTGVNTTYVCSVTVGGATFTHGAVGGEIQSDQGYVHQHFGGESGVTVANLTAPSTFVYLDKDNTIQQQITIPTDEDWVRKIFTMRIAVNLTTNQIVGFEYLNNPIGNYANNTRTIYSYLLAQGVPFKKDMEVTGRADLGFDLAAGSFLEYGGTGNIHRPHVAPFGLVENAEFYLADRTTYDAGGNTDIPKFWDNAGTLTAIGSTTLVGHRLYRFSDDNGNVVMQYGQGNYANMSLAKAGVLTEDYVLNPILKNATFLGWWIIESTATNTSGTTLTSFVEYTLGIQGGVSSGLSGAMLRGNNGSDILDAAIFRSSLALGNAEDTSDATKFANYLSTQALSIVTNETDWDVSSGKKATLVHDSDTEIQIPTNLPIGQSGTISGTQDATGGRALSVASGMTPWADFTEVANQAANKGWTLSIDRVAASEYRVYLVLQPA